MKQKFILIDEELKDKIIKITGTDYNNELDFSDIGDIIDDLIYEYHLLEEKLEEKEEYCRENHVTKQINPYEEYGICERDFH